MIQKESKYVGTSKVFQVERGRVYNADEFEASGLKNLQKNKAIKRIKPDSFEDVGEILRPIFVQFHRNTEH